MNTHKKATRVWVQKPGWGCKTIQKLDSKDLDPVNRIIKQLYDVHLTRRKQILDSYMIDLFGRPIFFKEKYISRILIRIGEMKDETGKSLQEMRSEFDSYLGCNVTLPVNSKRIIQAYKMIQNNSPVDDIKKILKIK